MKKINNTPDKVTKKIMAWAQKRDDIRAAVILGSRARVETPADEWSDLDIILVVKDPGYYLNSTGWLKAIDEIKILFLEHLPVGSGVERRVLFQCGMDVDINFATPAQAKQLMEKGLDAVTQMVMGRGYRILFDKDRILPPFTPLSDKPASHLLTEAEFTEIANDFWYHTVWTAKKLCRGELWTALRCCDVYMKNLLLKVIECHARVLHGTDYDTWYNGRFLERWADPRVIKGLKNTYARYDKKDIRRALLATMDLFRWITREIVEKTGYPYPATADDYATQLVNALLCSQA
jgi:aminoglycoside 6-adenylyltransferase